MVKGRKTNRRIYLLDGREIGSNEVGTTLHRARSDKHDDCASCLKPIRKGEEYFRMNTFDGYVFHKQCYFDDHLFDENQSIIVGVRTRTYYPYGKHMGFKRTQVICRKVTVGDLAEIAV